MAAINTAWVDNVVAEINAVPDCRALQQAIDQITAMINAQLAAIAAQLLALAGLMVVPTNLATCISWIQSQINLYTSLYNQALATQAALLLAQIRIIAAINNKIANLNCSITPVVVITLP